VFRNIPRILCALCALIILSACGNAASQTSAYVGCYAMSANDVAFLQIKEQDGRLISGNYYSDRGWQYDPWLLEPVPGSTINDLVAGVPPQLQGVLTQAISQFPNGYANTTQNFGIFRAQGDSYSFNATTFDTPFLLASFGVVPVYKVTCQ
jgi:hypothetical protein